MATIVIHKRTGQRYVLLGTAVGAVADASVTEEGLGLAFVCGPSGSVKLVRALDLIVVEVDGRAPSEVLEE